MVESTLPVWMAIMLAGTVTMIVVGHCNYYVPKDQKAKAEFFRNQRVAEGQDCSIYFSYHVSELAYLIIAFFIVISATISFVISSYQEIMNEILEFGVLGIIVIIVCFLLAFVVAVLFLIIIAVASEIEARKGIQKYYWAHYQVPVIDINKIEPFMREYPR